MVHRLAGADTSQKVNEYLSKLPVHFDIPKVRAVLPGRLVVLAAAGHVASADATPAPCLLLPLYRSQLLATVSPELVRNAAWAWLRDQYVGVGLSAAGACTVLRCGHTARARVTTCCLSTRVMAIALDVVAPHATLLYTHNSSCTQRLPRCC